MTRPYQSFYDEAARKGFHVYPIIPSATCSGFNKSDLNRTIRMRAMMKQRNLNGENPNWGGIDCEWYQFGVVKGGKQGTRRTGKWVTPFSPTPAPRSPTPAPPTPAPRPLRSYLHYQQINSYCQPC